MKKILFGFAMLLSVQGFSQLSDNQMVDSVDAPEKYYFKEFSAGRVYLKNGTVTDGTLNYQMKDKSIAFVDGNAKHMILTGLESIDSVNIEGFTYIPVGEQFYELLSSGQPSLLLSMYGKTKPRKASYVNHGSSKENQDIVANDVSSVYVNMLTKRNLELDFINTFWFYDNGKLNRIKGLKDFQKAFPTQKNEINSYVNQHKVDFHNVEDVVKLYDAVSKS